MFKVAMEFGWLLISTNITSLGTFAIVVVHQKGTHL
jgi:hypothetical protein